jgi:DNA-binding beta-propeller fold protein YncE
VIDPVSQAVLKRVLVGAGVSALKSDPATDLLYLGRKGDPTVAVYDPFSLIQSDFLRTGEGASHLAIDGEENNLYVARPEGRSVSVLNLNKRRVIAEIDVGEEPSWVALMGER